jgi:hypothetical protein
LLDVAVLKHVSSPTGPRRFQRIEMPFGLERRMSVVLGYDGHILVRGAVEIRGLHALRD